MVADSIHSDADLRIDAHVDRAHDALFLGIRGQVDMQIMITFIEAEISKFPANTTIMDFRGSDISGVTVQDLKDLSASGARSEQFRTNPRSAVIIDEGISEILARLYGAVNVADRRNLKFQTFRDVDSALAWLQIDAPPDDWRR